jgi:hypothetical protein
MKNVSDYTEKTTADFNFGDAKIYRKNSLLSKLDIEVCTKEHMVGTVVGGITETINTAYIGDFIITGKSCELYVIPRDKFPKLYQIHPANNSLYISKNVRKVIQLTEPVSIVAPWGEKQYGDTGSFITQGVNDENDVYIIEKDVFTKTYVNA